MTQRDGERQPDAEAALAAAARSGSEKPKDQGTGATPETAPRPSDLEAEQSRAARILAEGAGGAAATSGGAGRDGSGDR